jgi:exodeoxyribonuclease VII large subunit
MSGGTNQLFDPEAPPGAESAAGPDGADQGHPEDAVPTPEESGAPAPTRARAAVSERLAARVAEAERRARSGGPRSDPGPDPGSDPRDESGGGSGYDPELHRDTHPDVLSIGGLYEQVEHALARAFPRTRQLWIRGEIHHLSDHRSGHLYLELTDPDDSAGRSGPRGRGGVPTLNVKCWRTTWAPLRHALAKEGIELTEGMIVVLRGSLDLYRAKGELSLVLAEIDVTAILGRMAAQRAALVRKLETEGLLRANAALPVPDVTMHIGLVASPGTEGCNDFLGRLHESGFGFRVSFVPVSVQGTHAPASIARALRFLSRSDCDVIALVRGGGSRADLAAFETEIVARAVALAGKPVFTGIGHTGDETVADIVAARSCITPTECGHTIAVSTRQWWSAHVAAPADALARRVPAFLADAEARDASARGRLATAARHQLRTHGERLGNKAAALARRAPAALDGCETSVRSRATRLTAAPGGHLDRSEERVRAMRRLLDAYDVERQLERGYSLTLRADGTLVRGAGDVAVGDELVTRFADGSVHSRVEASRPAVAGSSFGPGRDAAAPGADERNAEVEVGEGGAS